MATATLTIDGMHCAACAFRIERALRKVPGALKADVNLGTRRAHVEFPSCPADRMKIAARPELSDATYDVDACGHVARYTCSRPSGYPLTCAREPDPQVSPP